MKNHFSVEILKEIKDGHPTYYTPIVNGFSISQYIEAPEEYTEILPKEVARNKLKELKVAIEWLFGKGYVHGDINPGNIMYNERLNKFTLIDFEMAQKTNKLKDLTSSLDDLRDIERELSRIE
jgi:thiamine kinase-like enzyme